MAKHPPFDAVPALSNGVWVREKAWVQMLQKQKLVASHISAAYVSYSFPLSFYPHSPTEGRNRKLSGRLLFNRKLFFFLTFFFYPASSFIPQAAAACA